MKSFTSRCGMSEDNTGAFGNRSSLFYDCDVILPDILIVASNGSAAERKQVVFLHEEAGRHSRNHGSARIGRTGLESIPTPDFFAVHGPEVQAIGLVFFALEIDL